MISFEDLYVRHQTNAKKTAVELPQVSPNPHLRYSAQDGILLVNANMIQKSQKNFSNHIFKCDKCDFEATSRHDLSRHQKAVHNNL